MKQRQNRGSSARAWPRSDPRLAGDRAGGTCRRVVFVSFNEDEMNVYWSIGYAVGTPEALALAARLSAWHDAMVAHERPADTARVARCDDDCPHAEAVFLWREAVVLFGEHAKRFSFLKRHASLQKAA